MKYEAVVYSGAYDYGVYGYIPALDFNFEITGTETYSNAVNGFSQAGDGFVFGGEIAYSDKLFYSDGSGHSVIWNDSEGNPISQPNGFTTFHGETVFMGYNDGNLYLTNGDGAPDAVLLGSIRDYKMIGDSLYILQGDDIYRLNPDFSLDQVLDGANSNLGDLSVRYFIEVDGELWVRGYTNGLLDNDFFKVDVTTGTVTEMNIAENGGGDSLYLAQAGAADGMIFGWMNSQLTGFELYASDGTAGNWALVDDIRPGGSSSYSGTQSALLDGKLIFLADDGGADDEELWVSDGTSGGTFALSGAETTVGTLAFGNFLRVKTVGDLTFFVARTDDAATAATGYELFVTDGTEAGTKLVMEFSAGSSGSEFNFMGGLNDQYLIFSTPDGDGSAVWVSDGTAQGTFQLANYSPDTNDVNASVDWMGVVELEGENLPLWVLEGKTGPDIWVGSDLDEKYLGYNGDDQLSGARGEDQLFGGHGHDTMSGGGGNDMLRGQTGNDSLLGDNGADFLIGDAGKDTLVGGNSRDRLVGGDDNDLLGGGAGADLLFGGEGNDRLIAGAGNDKLFGGNGADTLRGNSGDDHFAYVNAAESAFGGDIDRIVDFEIGGDLVDLRRVAPGKIDFETGAHSGTGPSLFVQVAGGNSTILVDVDGDGTSDMEILVTGVVGLSETDFLL